MGTGIICGNEACGMELDPDPPSGRQPCPACGSMARTQTVVVKDEAQVHEELQGHGTEEIATEITEPITDSDADATRSERKPRGKPRKRGSAKMKSGAKKKPTLKKPPKKKPLKKKKKPPARKSPKKRRK